MEVNSVHTKAWQRARDEAALSSAILHVKHAEQWARRLAPMLSREENLTAREVYNAVDMDLSGPQVSYAYLILRAYWKHSSLLVWESFTALCLAASASRTLNTHTKRKPRFHREHPARHVH